MKTALLIGGVVVVLGASAYAWHNRSSVDTAPQPIACTTEAMLCPDGSYVGRTGPKCEFAACPVVGTSTPITSGASGIVQGQVLLGPTCPVERIPPDPACAPKLYSTKIIAYKSNVALGQTSSDAQGKFSFTLPSGTYELRANGGTTYPICRPLSGVAVQAGQTTSVTLYCDTGIR